MINYNIIFVDGKVNNPKLNLSETEFLEKLWEWVYDDLWMNINDFDFLGDNKEGLEPYLTNTFIPEDLLHEYEDDELNCFCFIVEDGVVKEFNNYKLLYEFVMNKIKEHYEKV